MGAEIENLISKIIPSRYEVAFSKSRLILKLSRFAMGEEVEVFKSLRKASAAFAKYISQNRF